MKRSIEAGNLRQAGHRSANAFSTATAGGLCSGASGSSASIRASVVASTSTGAVHVRTAMHHAMTEADQVRCVQRPVRQRGQHGQRLGMILVVTDLVMHRACRPPR